jgi:hypothetical protein
MQTPKAPATPDPNVTAAAQTKSNLATATAQSELNNVNQVTPYGTITYTQVGTNADGTPKYQATTALNAQQQGLLDQTNALSSQKNNVASNLLNSASNTLSNPIDLTSDNLNKYIDSHYADQFNTQWNNSLEGLQSQLANQGIQIGSDAYTRAMNDYQTQKENAFNSLVGSQYANAQNAITTAYNQPLTSLSALQSGATNPNPAQTAQTGVQGTDVAGITQNAYNNAYQNYQTQVAQNNATLGGLFGIGSALAGGWAMSDRRAKKNVKKVGELKNGMGLYKFQMKKGMGGGGLTQLGVIAQQVEKVDPKAVRTGADGLKRVNYDRVMRRA